METLTQRDALELFEYADGHLFWKITRSSRAPAGKKAGSLHPSGYIKVGVNGHKYPIHRIIFLMHHGWLPTKVDHQDTNKLNNRIANLRPATTSENTCNSDIRANNTSGYKGVYWDKKHGKWRAQIMKDGKSVSLGHHDDPGIAGAAYAVAAKQLHSEFFRDNSPPR